MAKIKQSNQYDEVDRVIRSKRDRIICISLIVSLLFAIIMLILWFCYPSDISTDGQVEQVSADISKVLSSNINIDCVYIAAQCLMQYTHSQQNIQALTWLLFSSAALFVLLATSARAWIIWINLFLFPFFRSV